MPLLSAVSIDFELKQVGYIILYLQGKKKSIRFSACNALGVANGEGGEVDTHQNFYSRMPLAKGPIYLK